MGGDSINKNIDFDIIHEYYDLCITVDFDIPFWIEEAWKVRGNRLELMCGTGRISIPILASGSALTCVDYSAGLLSRFKSKIAERNCDVDIIHMDVRELDLKQQFDLVFIGFNAFAEIITRADQEKALQRIPTPIDSERNCSLEILEALT
ncbi:MAG: class I SAM-dependent methyltransferase [Deltaproteobacteria bacterium]|nr:class I SAM-dependent methyltransferase [Deltaproteobacteria bacterium]